jgi:hypothetical protein
MRNAHCRTWSAVRKLKIMENEKKKKKHGLTWNMARNTEKREK